MNPHHYAKKRAKELTQQNGMPYAANLAQVVREMTRVKAVQSAGPYSTGGGGTVLEHRFGAVLLSYLLTGRPVPALGDHITPTHVRFQGHHISRVDDILVRGRNDAGAEHLLSVGVRRQPRLVPSEVTSVQLMEAFLEVVIGEWPLLLSGRRRLALAVVPACRPAHQLASLTVVAAASPSPAEFRRRMTGREHASREVRDRLVQVDALVAAAVATGRTGGARQRPDELTSRLLSKLSLLELRLEGADLSDRTEAVGHLQRLTPRGLASEADALFSHLAELVGIYAPSGSEIDVQSLAADLEGLPCFVPSAGPTVAGGRVALSGVPKQAEGLPANRTRASSRQDAVAWSKPTLSSRALQPVLAGETLVVRDGYWLLGFDAATGEPMRPLQTAYSDPPVIGAGQVFVTDRASRIVPVDLRAGKKGQPLPARMAGGAAVVDRGTLFAAAPDADVHAVDLASRVVLWTQPVSGVPVAPPRVHAGRVFLHAGGDGEAGGTASDSSLWVFATDGTPQWVHTFQDSALLSWNVCDDRVWVVTRDESGLNTVIALDVSSGQVCWQQAVGGDVVGRPAAVRSCLYLTIADVGVITLDARSGRERWRTEGVVGRAAAAAHIGDGVVYLGLWQPRCLLALDTGTGAELWRKKTAGSFASAPFTASGFVYGGHRGGVLHGWKARSGREVWRAEVMWDEARQGGPLIVDGRAYVTSSNGKLQALALHD